MKRIDFVIIGAQKSGTTSLSDWIALHPQVTFCKNKEPHFFSSVADWKAELKEYHALFADWALPTKKGEASTSYTFFDECPEVCKRLYEYNPNLRLIYIVRNPIKRIESQFHHRKSRGRVNLSIDREVLRDSSYLNRTRYYYQLEPYLNYFGRDNILVLSMSEFINNNESIIGKLARHLEISPDGFPSNIPKSNTSIGQKVTLDEWGKFKKKAIIRYLPHRLKVLIRTSLFSNKIEHKEALSPKTRAFILEELEEDLENLKNTFGIEWVFH